MLWGSGTLGLGLSLGLKPHQYSYIHKYMDQNSSAAMLATKSQQMLHQRWIWGVHHVQVTKHVSEVVYPGFETLGRPHQKSKTGVSVAPQKGLMSSKKYLWKTYRQKMWASSSTASQIHDAHVLLSHMLPPIKHERSLGWGRCLIYMNDNAIL